MLLRRAFHLPLACLWLEFCVFQASMALSRFGGQARAQARAMFTGGMPPGGRLPGFWLSAPNIVPVFSAPRGSIWSC